MTRLPALADLFDVAGASLRPPLAVLVSAWADAHRVLPDTSAEPGPWRTDRTPYLREIMDRLSPQDPCEVIVVMKGAQIGMTAAAENWLGHSMHFDPSPMMMVLPTWSVAREHARDRIRPLVTSTPELKKLAHEQRSRKGGSTTVRTQFPGGFLVVVGANSAPELRARAIRRLVLDEVDGYPRDVDGEGDPVALAEKRTAAFHGMRKVLLLSTPTVRGESRIESEYRGSLDRVGDGSTFSPTDQRRYFVPCPGCGTFQTLEWEHVRWTEIGREPHDAAYVCPHCARVIEGWEKDPMLRAGIWKATATAFNPRVTGYHLSGLYRPHGWRGWGDVASDWVRAKRMRDMELLRVLVNTDLAQTWDITEGITVDPSSLVAHVEPAMVACPEQVLVLTAGVDVQEDRLEVEVVGWGDGEESWALDYRVIQGDTAREEVWSILDALLLEPRAHPSHPHGLAVMAVCVDSGFRTQTVYEFCKARRTRRVWAIKGATNSEQSPRPIWVARPTKVDHGRHQVHIIGVDSAKELVYARLGIEQPGPGCCHFLRPHCDDAYFAQLTAEKLRVRYHNGRAVHFWWKPENRRNEVLDCRVYATAALKALLLMGFRPRRTTAKKTPAGPEGGERPESFAVVPPPRCEETATKRKPARPSIWAQRPRSIW